MIQLILMMMIFILSIFFLIMNHPLTMGMMLMIETLMIALFSGSLSMNYWFSYSLFLIFMGGMLILFMYMTSLASNEIFKFSFNLKYMMMFIFIIIMMLITFYSFDLKNFSMNMIKNSENSSILKKTLFLENTLLLNKMFNFPINMITILMINYLFLTLIASVKITNIFKGPLRPSMKS